ncbi:protein of unknown function [Pustulibacterium marinum]|uniref:DUF922 domain-containing protein n=1 Tax=Pustulibacterium marinum TaxID=1224947 RepID=A0A1I7G657_9FLAO|nr:DUF922 domain-containing protein [Pustulibacterium marinum]SFU43937.1 protein of unknown function [Pustulibacterium marinum]
MKLKLVFYISCFLLLAFTTKDSRREEAIVWNGYQRLSWKDFQGVPDLSTDAAAVTASGLSYDLSASISKNEIVVVNCKVSAFFYPTESWFKPEFADDHILAHEQLHFDITELMARKFRKRIAETKFSKNVKAEVKTIYNQMNKSLDSLQTAYDASANYSMNKKAQLSWQKKINKELLQLNSYK